MGSEGVKCVFKKTLVTFNEINSDKTRAYNYNSDLV